ncbi:MotA/TolQ/ExbB proton channel family protein [Novipirellula aureliae]|uniref:MotA/TolQ/ExbB proton channel family protein n=1 Tax=Novipirellula aureliae TaxID=2527966 RepID=A0A5C6DJI6_9BACT|nr:MotA/TolQ/ExbB proton channel family protein [Novipirellula aureliae]TWU35741.1 MotA/TolQ/ExbB proton channel family protein [Novipirellula aureliae]
MNLLTNIFYLLATSLMIPVMLALLWCLVRTLLCSGATLRRYRKRMRFDSLRREIAMRLDASELPDRQVLSDSATWDESGVSAAVSKLMSVADNDVLAEKVVQDCQIHWSAQIDPLRTLARTGPALGLMGTLIPLGPALVGLAAGDLQTMSRNLVIAFATTVVGLLIGTLASFLASVHSGWRQVDSVLVTYAANRLAQIDLHHDSSDDDTMVDELDQQRNHREVAHV